MSEHVFSILRVVGRSSWTGSAGAHTSGAPGRDDGRQVCLRKRIPGDRRTGRPRFSEFLAQTDQPASTPATPATPGPLYARHTIRCFILRPPNPLYISTSRPNGFRRIYVGPFLYETAAPAPIQYYSQIIIGKIVHTKKRSVKK